MSENTTLDHDLMNLPCRKPVRPYYMGQADYEEGHRDARHAAVEAALPWMQRLRDAEWRADEAARLVVKLLEPSKEYGYRFRLGVVERAEAWLKEHYPEYL